MKKLLLYIFIAGLLQAFAPRAYAGYECDSQYSYGGCPPPTNVILNKTVQHPASGDFVDNLGVNDPMYAPNERVRYNITLTNVSNDTFYDVHVQDLFPQYVVFDQANYPYDAATQQFAIGDLAAGESKIIEITAYIAKLEALPQDMALIPAINKAIVIVNGQPIEDNAQLYIQKPVLSDRIVPEKDGLTVYSTQQVLSTPATGPEALALLGLIPTAMTGFYLRRKTR